MRSITLAGCPNWQSKKQIPKLRFVSVKPSAALISNIHLNTNRRKPTSLQDAAFFYGLSHGLKIAQRFAIFAPVCTLVPPFRVPSWRKNNREAFASLLFLVRRKGLEPPTYWFVASHSIQLSYRRVHTHFASACI